MHRLALAGNGRGLAASGLADRGEPRSPGARLALEQIGQAEQAEPAAGAQELAPAARDERRRAEQGPGQRGRVIGVRSSVGA